MERGYEKLDIFKLSRQLAIEVHTLSLKLPNFEKYEEGSQIRRSSKSVSANIVEGYCLRRHKNEYLQYLHRALGSCEETRLHLGFLYETKSFNDEQACRKLTEEYEKLGKMLFRFIDAVQREHLSPNYIKESDAEYNV